MRAFRERIQAAKFLHDTRNVTNRQEASANLRANFLIASRLPELPALQESFVTNRLLAISGPVLLDVSIELKRTKNGPCEQFISRNDQRCSVKRVGK